MSDANICPIEPRVVALEHQMIVITERVTQLSTDVLGVKDDTAVIRSVIVGSSRVAIFAKKHGSRIIAFVVGAGFASGYISVATFERLKTAMAYVLS